jgi:hypothetical protein
LVGKPARKMPPGRPRSRWEDYIKMVLEGIGWEGSGWIHLPQDMDQWTPVNTVTQNAEQLSHGVRPRVHSTALPTVNQYV